MEEAQRIRMLQCPEHPVDVVIDTDTFNEVDDQFALAYLLRNPDRLRLQAIYAAPFLNEKADTPKDGMEKSYQEILKLLELAGTPEYQAKVYKGAERFLEHTGRSAQEEQNRIAPAVSEASEDLIRRAMTHSAENPLYVIGIAAATNIASAILCEPKITERMVVVWLEEAPFIVRRWRSLIWRRIRLPRRSCLTAGYRWFSCHAGAWWRASRSAGRSWRSTL